MWSEHYTPPGVPTQGPWELKAKFGPQWRQVLVVGAVTEQCLNRNSDRPSSTALLCNGPSETGWEINDHGNSFLCCGETACWWNKNNRVTVSSAITYLSQAGVSVWCFVFCFFYNHNSDFPPQAAMFLQSYSHRNLVFLFRAYVSVSSPLPFHLWCSDTSVCRSTYSTTSPLRPLSRVEPSVLLLQLLKRSQNLEIECINFKTS